MSAVQMSEFASRRNTDILLISDTFMLLFWENLEKIHYF
jgi:hypothetical protein